ncbi:thiosulfate sulfurtransferase GlpE [Aliidiomarina halalkaliphila]|uniref:Thiosulfate sulfurtransferase GlpE n=1 Tax=Aliidiomarina halalkaliphila TaxID=2593535 RepID=A0A552X328_9GAMM|nr:thiosulfate sulfurtransferase GlpE [Aliidiomarina halalkaliphila]TRW49013.1 thiosulfate sulfurtransferase GlpE [Aliidiomarina halalkaliphila]
MGRFSTIALADAAKMIADGNAQVADIRDPNTFAAGHVAGAFRLSNDKLAEFMMQADREQPVLVFCYHGISSQSAGQYLAQQGFTEVYSVDGGMVAWADTYPDKLEQDA